MTTDKYPKIVLKISAIFLCYFTPLFLFIVLDIGNWPLQPNSFFGDLIVRHPYQWDYELMFAGLYLVWGIFIWRASKNLGNNLMFIRFTAWGFFVNASTMVITGLLKTQELAHLAIDSIPWLALSFLMFYFKKDYGKISVD